MNNRLYISEDYERWIKAVTRYQLAEARLGQRASVERLEERKQAVTHLRSVASGLIDGVDAAQVHVDISRCGLSRLIYTKAKYYANR